MFIDTIDRLPDSSWAALQLELKRGATYVAQRELLPQFPAAIVAIESRLEEAVERERKAADYLAELETRLREAQDRRVKVLSVPFPVRTEIQHAEFEIESLQGAIVQARDAWAEAARATSLERELLERLQRIRDEWTTADPPAMPLLRRVLSYLPTEK